MFSDVSNLTEREQDAVAFCGHIPAQVKKAQVKATVKKIEEEMTDEQKDKEQEVCMLNVVNLSFLLNIILRMEYIYS